MKSPNKLPSDRVWTL